MKKKIIRYFRHLFLTVVVLAAVLIPFGLYHGASLSYAHNPLGLSFDGEGPYVFYKNDSTLTVNYIRGNKDDGFSVDKEDYEVTDVIPAEVFFPLDSTKFRFILQARYPVLPTVYADSSPVLAVSDIESGYKTFRDFLISSRVIDASLNWTFGSGHLVLLGDFIDRGFSATQVLWFIYKLEQEAAKHGGRVHFILGNHELKNLYGDYEASGLKYTYMASIMGKTQASLYDSGSFMGRWLASKNAVELINGRLFVHGGLHPDIVKLNMSLEEINNFLRSQYYTAPYPKAAKEEKDLLVSSKTGPCWYRGYFKDDLSQEDVEKPLNLYQAQAVIVGHTLQSKIKRRFKGKVIGIDVKHPKDYHKNWPNKKSEGLLIEGDRYYRVLHNGVKREI